ncbi:hypothetical protein V6N13_148396 [Hibiscus sabdariffa]
MFIKPPKTQINNWWISNIYVFPLKSHLFKFSSESNTISTPLLSLEKFSHFQEFSRSTFPSSFPDLCC